MNNLKAKNDIVSFLEFMLDNPELRFWQGLLAWEQEHGNSKTSKIMVDVDGKMEDTFYK